MTVEAEQQEGLDDIIAWLDEKPTLARSVGAARRLDELRERSPGLFADITALVVRNFTLEPIEPLLRVAAYRAAIHLRISYSGYEPGAAATLEQIAKDDPDVVLLAVRLEELAPTLTRDFLAVAPVAARDVADDAVDHVVSLARGVRAVSRASLLVHNFVTPLAPAAGLADSQHPTGQVNLVRWMNVHLAERLADVDGAHVLDVDHLFARLGLGESSDNRGARVSDAPLSQAALRALAEAQVRHLRALRGPAAKCVIVDCDNTLWGGVVGEDGLAGLVLGETGAGRQHRDFQQSLIDLRRRGVVLAVCSKNEPADVQAVLRTHPDCLLSEDDFAAMRVNWEDKSENIASLAGELNLGLEHLVFVDDNPVECEWVKSRLPAVRVIQWPGDLHGGTLDDLGLFDSLLVTDEDRRRTELYQAEGKRRAARQEVTSVEDYLRSLQMVAVVGPAGPERLPRIAQLTQRTNQFNLTTRRHDAATLEGMLRSPDTRVIWLELRDRFGSNGVIGCGIVRREGDDAVIDTLLISCRVIGRGVESVLVNRLGALALELGAGTLVGEYIPSERNAQVADLYPRLGFSGAGPWRWDLESGAPAAPDWIEIIDTEEDT